MTKVGADGAAQTRCRPATRRAGRTCRSGCAGRRSICWSGDRPRRVEHQDGGVGRALDERQARAVWRPGRAPDHARRRQVGDAADAAAVRLDEDEVLVAAPGRQQDDRFVRPATSRAADADALVGESLGVRAVGAGRRTRSCRWLARMNGQPLAVRRRPQAEPVMRAAQDPPRRSARWRPRARSKAERVDVAGPRRGDVGEPRPVARERRMHGVLRRHDHRLGRAGGARRCVSSIGTRHRLVMPPRLLEKYR